MPTESTIPTPATADVCTYDILSEGRPLSESFRLLSVVVQHALNRISTAVLLFEDGDAAESTFPASDAGELTPGKQIEIKLGYRSNNQTVFKGIVVSHNLRIRPTGNRLEIECRHNAVKMTAVKKSRYFTEMKDSEILDQLISNYAISASVDQTDADLKEVVQYDATDWDFMLLRAEANGLVVFTGPDKISVKKPQPEASPVLTARYGSSLLEFDARLDARNQNESIKTVSWQPSEQQILEVEAREPQRASAGNLSPQQLFAVLDGGACVEKHGGALRQSELQAWADARLVKERLAFLRGRAKFQGFAGIRPGKVVEIQGVGSRFSGKLYISGVRHSLAQGDWTTDAELGLNPELFVSQVHLHPIPAAGLVASVNGLHTGIVTQLSDDPDGEDRIKVRLPLISDSSEGWWARIATLDAGAQRGTFFRPEIGDEVIVGFMQNDPRFPVVLGMCHSSAKPAPEPANDNNHLKGFVSREKMKLVFDDENKVISIETPSGNKVVISEQDKGISLTDENGNKFVLNNQGVVIESMKDLKINAPGDITVEGVNITISANSALKAEGSGSAELSGASTTLKGSATTVIQGGVVQIN